MKKVTHCMMSLIRRLAKKIELSREFWLLRCCCSRVCDWCKCLNHSVIRYVWTVLNENQNRNFLPVIHILARVLEIRKKKLLFEIIINKKLFPCLSKIAHIKYGYFILSYTWEYFLQSLTFKEFWFCTLYSS